METIISKDFKQNTFPYLPNELELFGLVKAIKRSEKSNLKTELSKVLDIKNCHTVVFPLKGEWQGFIVCQLQLSDVAEENCEYVIDMCTETTNVLLGQMLCHWENKENLLAQHLAPFCLNKGAPSRKLGRILELLNQSVFQYPRTEIIYDIKFDSLEIENRVYLFGTKALSNDHHGH